MSLQNELKGKDIELDANTIGSFINRKGVIVKAVVRGGKNSYIVTPKIYGVKDELLTQASKTFLDEYNKNGRITFIPKEDEDGKKIRSIEAKLRKKIKSLAVGFDDSFIPNDSFDELQNYFLNCKEEFEETRDKLVNKYSEMFSRFVEVTENSLDDFNATEGKEELSRIIESLPNEEEFKESFEIGLYVSEFPSLDISNLHLQEDVIKEMVNASLTKIIDDAIESLSALLRGGADEGRIHPKILSGVKNSTERMKKANIFGNQMLNEIRLQMKEIQTMDADESIEVSERLIANLYHYAKEVGLDKNINLKPCLFSKEELDDIYDMYHN